MSENKPLNEIDYQFKGNLNASLVKGFVIFAIPLGFVLYFLSAAFGKFIQACSLGIILSGIIYFFIRFGSENNLILFTNEGLIHYRKKSSQKYHYSDVRSIRIIKSSKSGTTVYMTVKGKEMDFTLEKKNYSNFTYDEFSNYVLASGSPIKITKS